MPALPVQLDRVGWRGGTDGVMLRATARTLRLPIVDNGPIMVVGASEEQARKVQEGVIRAGLDARTVQIYIEPGPVIPPTALLVTAVGMVVLVLAVGLVATRAQARTLRGYLARLIVIGVPPAWARSVLLYQHAVLIGTSTLLGLVIAVLPAAVLAVRIRGFVLGIPYGQLLVLLAAVYIGTALAALLSVTRLRAAEGL